MEKMVGSNFPLFSDFVTSDERIESYVNKGKLSCIVNASSRGKKFYFNFPQKKEGEANTIMGGIGNRAQHLFVVLHHQVEDITPPLYPKQIPQQQLY